MGWNENEIDELGRSSLGSLEKEPPPLAFEKIRKKVLWYSFWHLRIGSFVRRCWMILAATAMLVVSGYLFFAPDCHNYPAIPAFDQTTQNSFGNNNIALADLSTRPNTLTHSDNTSNNISNQTNPSLLNKPDASKNTSTVNTTVSGTAGISDNKTAINTYSTSSKSESQVSSVASVLTQVKAQTVSVPIKTNETVTSHPQNSLSTENIKFEKLFPIFQLLDEARQPALCQQQSTQSIKNSRIGWSFMAGANSGYSSSFLYPATENQSLIHRRISAPVSPTMEIRVDFGQWFLSAGLQQTVLDNKYHAKHLLFNETSGYEFSLVNQFWDTDTTGYWNYTYMADSVIHVLDSIWDWRYDSLLVQEYDSIQVNSYDTLDDACWTRSIKLVEIPLMAGHVFYVKNFMFSFSAGFGLGMLYQTSGKMYAGQDSPNPYVFFDTQTQKKFSVSFIGKGSAAYLLNERFAIEIGPWYRRMVTSSDFSEEPTNRKPWSVGLSAGIRIFF